MIDKSNIYPQTERICKSIFREKLYTSTRIFPHNENIPASEYKYMMKKELCRDMLTTAMDRVNIKVDRNELSNEFEVSGHLIILSPDELIEIVDNVVSSVQVISWNDSIT